VACLQQYALPFFEGLRTPEQLSDWVQTPVPQFGVFPAQVPLILATLESKQAMSSKQDPCCREHSQAAGDGRSSPRYAALRPRSVLHSMTLDIPLRPTAAGAMKACRGRRGRSPRADLGT
jgi:hypothetical protein